EARGLRVLQVHVLELALRRDREMDLELVADGKGITARHRLEMVIGAFLYSSEILALDSHESGAHGFARELLGRKDPGERRKRIARPLLVDVREVTLRRVRRGIAALPVPRQRLGQPVGRAHRDLLVDFVAPGDVELVTMLE